MASVAASWAKRATTNARLLWHLRPLGARLEAGSGLYVEGLLWVPGEGRVVLGRGVRFLGGRVPIELRAHAGAEIVVGDDVVLEAGASIEATRSVRVGAGAHLGAFSKVLDNHFHRTIGDRGERPEAAPIVIGERAVLGPRAVLLPGASLGARARVAAGRVVSFRMPDGMELRTDLRAESSTGGTA
jgi:acetyltransferase-like isoleucine patch superfamily enzyme